MTPAKTITRSVKIALTVALLASGFGIAAEKLVGSLAAASPTPADSSPSWPSWRGSEQNGASREIGLVDSWSAEGENLLWKAPVGGRSTPIVMNGRVCIITLGGEDKLHWHERVVCLDAETGEIIWEHGFNVFLTDIPWHRVGWSNLAGDPETGNIYAHGIEGMFICFDGDGNILWSRSLTEEFGRISGYGGRTNTPVVDGNLVILSYLNSGWGNQVRGSHRFFGFDKVTGELVWVSQPGGAPLDTTYSVPVVTVINGQRLLIAPNADGWIYALKIRTGEKVWGFQLSKRGINSSVVVDGNLVYVSHSEENIDGSTALGRLVCIDATGTGDVTKTHEVWRIDGFGGGYASPTIHGGRLFHINNSAVLHSVDATTGEIAWTQSLGTVQKGSPTWADGKLYVSEVDGKFYILRPGRTGCRILDREDFKTAEGDAVQINGSPAIANGRIYLLTRNALYAIGEKNRRASFSSPPEPLEEPSAESGAKVAHVQIVPGEVVLSPGETVSFTARAYDDGGRFLREVSPTWSRVGLQGTLDRLGTLTIAPTSGPQAGSISARVGDLTASARVRVIPPLPLREDFEGVEEGKVPAGWIAATGKFVVETRDGSRVLKKLSQNPRFWRTNVYIGTPTMSSYTVQADLLGVLRRRRIPDMGLIANRYILDIKGSQQRLQVRTWLSELRMSKWIDFSWKPSVWYRVKMRVDTDDDKAIIRGKVWPRNEPEPRAWTIDVEDPLPNREGSPGLYGYSSSDIYYDNVIVSRNTP